jgi:hypothetical protein
MKSEPKIRSKVAAQIVGIAFLLAPWAIAGTPWNWTAAAAGSMALAGGFLCGLTVAYDNSAHSWPILKPLLRDDALDLLKAHRS